MATTNPRPVREAAERVLPRACCACSHQLQNPLRGPAPNRAGVAHGQPHSVCDNVVDTDVIAFVIVLSVAIVTIIAATGDTTAVVAVAVVVVGAIVDVVAATGDATAVLAVAVVVAGAIVDVVAATGDAAAVATSDVIVGAMVAVGVVRLVGSHIPFCF